MQDTVDVKVEALVERGGVGENRRRLRGMKGGILVRRLKLENGPGQGKGIRSSGSKSTVDMWSPQDSQRHGSGKATVCDYIYQTRGGNKYASNAFSI